MSTAPHVCLGKHFTLLATLLLAEVGKRCRLRLVPGPEIGIRWSGTLRSDRNVSMVLEPRTGI